MSISRDFGAPALGGESRRADPLLLFAIFFLAVTLRIAAALWLPDQHFPDAQAYRDMARQLWQSHTFTNPYCMPLYPLIVAVVGEGWPQTVADIVLSTIMVWLIYDLTCSLFSDRRVALIAALMTASYPYFVFYAVVGLTETLFITLVLGAFAAWYRGNFALADILVVLSILTRPATDLLPWILIPYFALVIHRLPLRNAVWRVIQYALIYVIFLAPWWVHNYETYGKFVRLDLGLGQALYWGNNPQNQTGGVTGVSVDTAQFDEISDPFSRDQAFRDAAIQNIKANPAHYLKLAGLKFLRFWRLYPFAEAYSTRAYVVVSLLSFAPILILAVAFILTCGRSNIIAIVPIVLYGCYLTIVHVIIVASIRYRLPIEPFLIVLAAKMSVKIYDQLPSFLESAKK